MNAPRKTKALKDFAEFAELEENELSVKLSEAGYSEAEISELIPSLKGEPKSEIVKFDPAEFVNVSTTDDDGFVELHFDNSNWKAYKEIEKGLNGMIKHDFFTVLAHGIFEKKDQNGQTINVLRGIKLKKDKPLSKTRIQLNLAREANQNIYNSPNVPNGIVYYLLADYVNLTL
jgi:hypothetical protein